jgi:NusA-like KH domain protein
MEATRTLDMQFIRYANLFNQITRIRTNHCFEYNNTVIFVVPKSLIARSIGPNNINLEKLSSIIRKKVKVISIPKDKTDLENFVSILVRPIRIKGIEIKEDEAVISTNPQSKASLIGRGKLRLAEMENILGQYFGVRKVRIK